MHEVQWQCCQEEQEQRKRLAETDDNNNLISSLEKQKLNSAFLMESASLWTRRRTASLLLPRL